MITKSSKIGIAALVPLMLSGCLDASARGQSRESGGGTKPTFALVSHANAGDKFWDVVKNGEERAGEDLGVRVTYQGSGDPQRQGQLIDAAVSQKVDGLIVSMANPDALRAPIRRAVDAGIPVITINSGAEKSADVGALVHVGQSEEAAGRAAGERLAQGGMKHVVCIIHEAGNVGLEQRCAGAKQTFGGTLENLQVTVSDLAGATSTITSRLQSDRSIDGALTLNSSVASAAVRAIAQANRPEVAVATFDVDASVLGAVASGRVLFAVDQQPYLQGYLPIVLLNLHNNSGSTAGGGQPVATGPSFVDKSNVERVQKLVAAGKR